MCGLDLHQMDKLEVFIFGVSSRSCWSWLKSCFLAIF
jgi:hypothetical protein